MLKGRVLILLALLAHWAFPWRPCAAAPQRIKVPVIGTKDSGSSLDNFDFALDQDGRINLVWLKTKELPEAHAQAQEKESSERRQCDFYYSQGTPDLRLWTPAVHVATASCSAARLICAKERMFVIALCGTDILIFQSVDRGQTWHELATLSVAQMLGSADYRLYDILDSFVSGPGAGLVVLAVAGNSLSTNRYWSGGEHKCHWVRLNLPHDGNEIPTVSKVADFNAIPNSISAGCAADGSHLHLAYRFSHQVRSEHKRPDGRSDHVISYPSELCYASCALLSGNTATFLFADLSTPQLWNRFEIARTSEQRWWNKSDRRLARLPVVLLGNMVHLVDGNLNVTFPPGVPEKYQAAPSRSILSSAERSTMQAVPIDSSTYQLVWLDVRFAKTRHVPLELSFPVPIWLVPVLLATSREPYTNDILTTRVSIGNPGKRAQITRVTPGGQLYTEFVVRVRGRNLYILWLAHRGQRDTLPQAEIFATAVPLQNEK